MITKQKKVPPKGYREFTYKKRRYYVLFSGWKVKDKNLNDLRISVDGNKRRWVCFSQEESLPLDIVVASTYISNPCCSTEVIHLDGQPWNCAYTNLKWAPVYDKDGWFRAGSNLWVSKEGEARMQDGTLYDIFDFMYDSDTDSNAVIEPYIRYHYTNLWGRGTYKLLHIEDLVAAAFVEEPSELERPRLLHINNDFHDCKASNLKWVDEKSPEYIAFKKKMREEQLKRAAEVNQGKDHYYTGWYEN